jgi:hypothetical protein
MAVANTQAYYNTAAIKAVKGFIVKTPRACTKKLFMAVIFAVSYLVRVFANVKHLNLV